MKFYLSNKILSAMPGKQIKLNILLLDEFHEIIMLSKLIVTQGLVNWLSSYL